MSPAKTNSWGKRLEVDHELKRWDREQSTDVLTRSVLRDILF